jgi:hypothetical protein
MPSLPAARSPSSPILHRAHAGDADALAIARLHRSLPHWQDGEDRVSG